MHFKQVQDIIDGTKTQTRRVVKDGEAFAFMFDGSAIEHVEIDRSEPFNPMDAGYTITKVYTAAGRLKWQVGRDYSVSPGRGKPGALWCAETKRIWSEKWADENPMSIEWFVPLRIRITAIRRERLQDISEADARDEGFPRDVIENLTDGATPVQWYRNLWESINKRAPHRWEDNPEVWVLIFEVVK